MKAPYVNRGCLFSYVAILALNILSLSNPASATTSAAPTDAHSTITGYVVDATDGAAIPNVSVAVSGTSVKVTTDTTGRFIIKGLPVGSYVLSLYRDGYQPAISDSVLLRDTGATVTMALQPATGGDLKVIAVTSTRANNTLRQSSTFSETFNAESLQRQGVLRAANVLLTAAGVNNGIPGNTGALADDVHLSIRGIGTLETVAAIDGHPIGYGIKGGFNYQLSPVYPYRNISVIYGSGGSNFFGLDAIGGVVNFETLDPTPERHVSFTQGYGSFEQLSSSLQATGTIGNLGYAIAYGTAGLDGPFRHAHMYQTGAAFDQSVEAGPIHQLGVYPDDSSAQTRASLVKLRLGLGHRSSLTLTSLTQNRWADKTGNGDGDYLSYAPALALGYQLLSDYAPSNYPTLQPCAPGRFVGTNANGKPNGFGPTGQPDGGLTCQTPQQYAQFNTGWDGAGPSWQSLKLNDNSLSYQHNAARSVFRFDVYNSYYANLSDRTFRLPFFKTPGDNASWSNLAVNETGAVASEELLGLNNDIGVGISYLNSVYPTYSKGALKGSPSITDSTLSLSDEYHPHTSPFSAFATLWAKRSTATDTSYLDGRLALVDRLTTHDIVRGSIGLVTTQPSANMVGLPFIGDFTGGAGGGTPINCSTLNAIGSTPSTVLKPERGVDEDIAYVHRWADDTQTQLTLYNTNVFDKLYSTLVPLSSTGTGFIPPSYLAMVTAAIAGKCGATIAPSLLGLNGNFNVGTLRARGVNIHGRIRATRALYFDYDWALTSTVLLSANPQLLQNDKSLIIDSQLPKLPLHTFNGSADYTFHNGLEARYTLYTVSNHNTKSLPAYNYSNVTLSFPTHKGVLTATVFNIFGQFASIAGLRYEGVPLPLNGYATGADYTQYTGTAATERFGLPYRTIYVSFQYQL